MAAPVQRGTSHITFTAPTCTEFTIDATTFRLTRGADQITIKNESAETILDVFSDPTVTVHFEGTLKTAQTPKIRGDTISLTFPASHTPTGAIIFVIVNDPEDSGYGQVIRQSIQAKKPASVTYS
jgi:hypothetical protein